LRKIRSALDLSIVTQKELKNARIRLDNEGFDDEIEILDKYKVILVGILEYAGTETVRAAMEEEIAPPVEDRSLNEHLENLFREMALDMGARGTGTIAISGFTSRDEKSADLLAFLNEMALLELTKCKNLQVVERNKLDMVLEEQKLVLGDLMDTSHAVTVGKTLAANHILTGSVIEMSSSVVIFGRIINVETGEIESVAQVIVPNDKVQEALL
jgi:TolB-like protein